MGVEVGRGPGEQHGAQGAPQSKMTPRTDLARTIPMPKSSAGPAVVQLAASKSSTKSKSSKALANKFSAATSGLLTMQMKVVAVAKSGATTFAMQHPDGAEERRCRGRRATAEPTCRRATVSFSGECPCRCKTGAAARKYGSLGGRVAG